MNAVTRPAARIAAFAALLGMSPLLAQDSDGDAIPDSVETQDWYRQAGGDLDVQDVWVECDYMPGTVKKLGKIVSRTRETFERAPVPSGIALHVTFDDHLPFEEQWGDATDFPDGFLATREELLAARASHFDGAPFAGAEAEVMRDYIHYCACVNDVGGPSGYTMDSTNPWGGIPGDMFVLALGRYQGVVPAGILRLFETGTLLHELGHNLGLTHGGARPQRHGNYKPNYLSVMNYLFQVAFIRERPAGEAEHFAYWDYSRQRSNRLRERHLVEARGVDLDDIFPADGSDFPLLGAHYCPNGDLFGFRWNSALDYDCDQTLDSSPVQVDLTRDGSLTRLGRGQDNWEHLVFDGGAVAGRGSRLAPAFTDPRDELDLPTLLRLVREVPQARVAAPAEPPFDP